LKYLVDTDVISAVAPQRPDRSAELVGWLEQTSPELALSVITAAEIRDGIAKARREGATRKASLLAQWWETIEHLYSARILPFDLDAARIAGALADKARAAGLAPGFADIAIAATVSRHGLTLLTRNIRHFSMLGIAVIDPFETLPPL